MVCNMWQPLQPDAHHDPHREHSHATKHLLAAHARRVAAAQPPPNVRRRPATVNPTPEPCPQPPRPQ
eukprot:6123338-Alexandrium_andersonii.AAC.1